MMPLIRSTIPVNVRRGWCYGRYEYEALIPDVVPDVIPFKMTSYYHNVHTNEVTTLVVCGKVCETRKEKTNDGRTGGRASKKGEGCERRTVGVNRKYRGHHILEVDAHTHGSDKCEEAWVYVVRTGQRSRGGRCLCQCRSL